MTAISTNCSLLCTANLRRVQWRPGLVHIDADYHRGPEGFPHWNPEREEWQDDEWTPWILRMPIDDRSRIVTQSNVQAQVKGPVRPREISGQILYLHTFFREHQNIVERKEIIILPAPNMSAIVVSLPCTGGARTSRACRQAPLRNCVFVLRIGRCLPRRILRAASDTRSI